MSHGPSSLRAWIELLREVGELRDVEAKVDPYLEVTEIVDRTIRAQGPALLFHHPRGALHPLLINQFGTERRMCLAFGAGSLDEVADRVNDVLNPRAAGPRAAARFRKLADCEPRTVERGPCQELVLEPDLNRFPIQTCWPGDPAPFMTLPAVITSDPRTGARNVGTYRMQKIDARTTFMHWQIHKDGAADLRAADERLEVAVALGLDPVSTYMASAPLPRDIDELALAGYLRGEAVEMVRAKTVSLDVPANAEIVIEGYIDVAERGIEGPFGDHTGYYSPAEPFPIFHATCMTMRHDAIYPSIVVGLPPAEDAWLGKASERISLPAIRASLPELVDYDLPVAGAFQNCAVVSIRKAFPGQARKAMHALWGLGVFCLLKSIVVVDEFIDVHDYEQVFFQVCANVDPARDLVVSEGPLDQLDHAAIRHCYGGRLGIDATHKLPAEGARDWPQRLAMSAAIREQVDERWPEYGIDGPRAHANGGSARGSLPF